MTQHDAARSMQQGDDTQRGSNTDERAVTFNTDEMRQGFTVVPNYLLDFGLSVYALATLIQLMSYAWRSDDCWPGQDGLCSSLGISKPTLRKAIDELEAAGLVRSRQRGMGKTNIYTLLISVKGGLPRNETTFHPEGNDVSTKKDKLKKVNGLANARPVEFAQQTLSGEVESTDDADPVTDVFAHWQATMDKPRAKLTSDRRSKIKARLADGYTLDEIKAAIDGCARTPHNMGENDRGQRYDDLTLILRSGSHLERFRDTTAGKLKRDRHRLGHTTIDNEAAFARGQRRINGA